MEPVSPALAGRFLTTEPPGKSSLVILQWVKQAGWLVFFPAGVRALSLLDR